MTENSKDRKTALVTGGTGGIGKATAAGLLSRGISVILVGRDAARGEAAVRELSPPGADPPVRFLRADLGSQREVRLLAETVRQTVGRLNILIQNAGTVFSHRTLTVDGLEATFAINHLAPFLLTHLLIEPLLEAGGARVLAVSSGAHGAAKLEWDNLQFERRYSEFQSYARSKLANVLFAYELARRVEGSGITSNALEPGFVRTGIFQRSTGFFRVFGWLGRPFQMTPERAAVLPVSLATATEFAGTSGEYFSPKGRARSSQLSYHREAARRLWEESARMTGLEPEALDRSIRAHTAPLTPPEGAGD